MTTQRVFLEAAVVVPHLVHGDPAFFQQPFQFGQLPALMAYLLAVDLSHRLAGVGQDETPVQKFHALAERVQVGLVVQCQTQPGQMLPDGGEAVLQLCLIRMNQREVIHVADIMPDAQPLFNDVVQVIQHRQRHKLAHFAAQADAVISAE